MGYNLFSPHKPAYERFLYLIDTNKWVDMIQRYALVEYAVASSFKSFFRVISKNNQKLCGLYKSLNIKKSIPGSLPCLPIGTLVMNA
jgi:hypothetical protein